MASGAEHFHTPTIEVLTKEFRGGLSLRQLARELSADPSNVRKAKNWLIENRHPSFDTYVADSSLSPEQAEAIALYRSYTTDGIKGDALTEKMFPDTATSTAKKNALRDLFEHHGISPELAAKLTYQILRIFDS